MNQEIVRFALSFLLTNFESATEDLNVAFTYEDVEIVANAKEKGMYAVTVRSNKTAVQEDMFLPIPPAVGQKMVFNRDMYVVSSVLIENSQVMVFLE